MITESGFEIIGGCKVYEYEVACPNYTRAKKAGGFFAAVLALLSALFAFLGNVLCTFAAGAAGGKKTRSAAGKKKLAHVFAGFGIFVLCAACTLAGVGLAALLM